MIRVIPYTQLCGYAYTWEWCVHYSITKVRMIYTWDSSCQISNLSSSSSYVVITKLRLEIKGCFVNAVCGDLMFNHSNYTPSFELLWIMFNYGFLLHVTETYKGTITFMQSQWHPNLYVIFINTVGKRKLLLEYTQVLLEKVFRGSALPYITRLKCFNM